MGGSYFCSRRGKKEKRNKKSAMARERAGLLAYGVENTKRIHSYSSRTLYTNGCGRLREE